MRAILICDRTKLPPPNFNIQIKNVKFLLNFDINVFNH
jgi:hypothetical protein